LAETDLITIKSDRLSAAISPVGAELRRLQDADGRDLLSQAEAPFWAGRSPILFPIVGAVADKQIRVGGRSYPMGQHGFVRTRPLAVAEQRADAVAFRLEDDAETRAAYPFPFRLTIGFELADAALAVTATLTNTGKAALPASFGFHPALQWPLPYGQPRAAHRIVFAKDEPGPIRRIGAGGVLRPEALPSPVRDRTLALADELFTEGALIWTEPRSRAVRYGAPGAPAIEVRFPEMPHLGVWTQPGAPFVCIEPWCGYNDPAGFAGEFRDKPGVIEVAPGARAHFAMRIALIDSFDTPHA
jgi:galactose mutarotase-like enzyme